VGDDGGCWLEAILGFIVGVVVGMIVAATVAYLAITWATEG